MIESHGVSPAPPGYDPSSLRNGARVGELGERRRHRRVVAMADEVDEEQVFPQAGARRARLEARHRHAVLRERLEQLRSTAPGRFGADITSDVSSWPDGADLLATEHPEARRVVGLVLDVRRERSRGRRSRPHSRRRSRRRPPRPPRARAASALLATATRGTAGQMLREPLHALRERLRVRIDASSPASSAPAFDRRFCWMRSFISPQIDRSVVHMRSSVRPTAPSVEFSTGHHARSRPARSRPRGTLRRSSSTAPRRRTRRNACATAAWLNVPAGPR